MLIDQQSHTTTKGSNRSKVKTLHSKTESKNKHMSGWGDAISDTELPTNSKRKPKS